MENLKIKELVKGLKGKQRNSVIKELSLIQFPVEHDMLRLELKTKETYNNMVYLTTFYLDGGIERGVEISKTGKVIKEIY